jgi:hypothetical protein
MVIIRKEQMQVFEHDVLRRFKEEMVQHLFQFAPTHCEGIGEENVLRVIALGMERSALYGFTNRGPVRFYLELMFLFGSYFDTDPQLPLWATEILQGGTIDDQMARADCLHARTLEYRRVAIGPSNAYAQSAVQRFRGMAAQPLPFLRENLVDGLLAEIQKVYPERCTYVGERALRALIEEGIVTAERQALTTVRGMALCVLLMFQLGHGCFEDPLYPWIARTLEALPVEDSSMRAQRLERRAMVYLELILKRLGQG